MSKRKKAVIISSSDAPAEPRSTWPSPAGRDVYSEIYREKPLRTLASNQIDPHVDAKSISVISGSSTAASALISDATTTTLPPPQVEEQNEPAITGSGHGPAPSTVPGLIHDNPHLRNLLDPYTLIFLLGIAASIYTVLQSTVDADFDLRRLAIKPLIIFLFIAVGCVVLTIGRKGLGRCTDYSVGRIRACRRRARTCDLPHQRYTTKQATDRRGRQLSIGCNVIAKQSSEAFGCSTR